MAFVYFIVCVCGCFNYVCLICGVVSCVNTGSGSGGTGGRASSSSCWLTKYLLSLINSDKQNDHCVLQKIFDCKMAKLTGAVKHFHDIIFDDSA